MRYFLEIAYKGSNYHGWQIQPNANTVQAELEKALSTYFKTKIETTGSGRTDTGVHASQQFVHFDSPIKLDPPSFVNSMNGILPKDICALDLKKVRDDAHARFDATKRGYIYKIKYKNTPFSIGEYYLFKRELDVDQMNEAAKILLHHSDFESFSKVHTEVKTFICNITRAEWVKTHDGINFHIEADRFLRGMVRALVGTLKEIGLGKVSVNDFEEIILAKDRQKAGAAAPAQGLFLCKVEYPKEIFVD